jgi:hypothetical protein
MAVPCEHSNELLGSVKRQGISDHLNNYQLLKKLNFLIGIDF